MALTLAAVLWTRAAAAAVDASDPFCRAKLPTARFFMHKILAETHTLLERIRAGAGSVMALDPAEF